MSKLSVLFFIGLSAAFVQAGVKCPKQSEVSVYIPHESDCRKFYQCTAGYPQLFLCPDGLYFDTARGICDWTSDCLISDQSQEIPSNENNAGEIYVPPWDDTISGSVDGNDENVDSNYEDVDFNKPQLDDNSESVEANSEDVDFNRPILEENDSGDQTDYESVDVGINKPTLEDGDSKSVEIIDPGYINPNLENGPAFVHELGSDLTDVDFNNPPVEENQSSSVDKNESNLADAGFYSPNLEDEFVNIIDPNPVDAGFIAPALEESDDRAHREINNIPVAANQL